MRGNFSYFSCSDFFQNKPLQILSETLSESQTILDPDKDQQNVNLDLGTKILQRLSADNKSHC